MSPTPPRVTCPKLPLPRLILILLGLAFALLPLTATRAAEPAAPLRIFLRGGPKTHGPATNGQHDGPTWLKEWQPLLAARGAQVNGALRFPSAEELEQTDVLVMFAADAGTILGEQRASLEKFLKRGGGIVCLHDAVVTGRDPLWFKSIVGGSWQNGVAKYFEGPNTYYYVNPEHPITKGAANFTIDDEVYWDLHLMPNAQILASTMQPVRPARGATAPAEPAIGKLIPQIWVYENQLEGGTPYRAFVSLLGHHFASFASPHVRGVLLRGIAWAGGRDADLLTTPEEVAALK
jgi:type 1 glutamine amidotransferase